MSNFNCIKFFTDIWPWISKPQNIISIFLALSSVLSAVYAGGVFYETRLLRLADEKPNIVVDDVVLSLIDETNTLVKDRSWATGETLNINAVHVDPKKSYFIVALKFTNTGRESSSVTLVDRVATSNNGSKGNFINTKPNFYINDIVVPGRGKSGLEFGFKMSYNSVIGSIQKIENSFIVKSLESGFVKELTIIIQCDLSGEGGTHCRPIPSI